MTDVEAMTVVDGMDDLLEVVEGFGLGEATSLDEVFEEFAAFDVFHDDEAEATRSKHREPSANFLHNTLRAKQEREAEEKKAKGNEQFSIRLPNVIQVHHIRMINQLHNDDLPLDTQQDLVGFGAGFGDGHSGGEDGLLGDDFDGGFLACYGVAGKADDSCE